MSEKDIVKCDVPEEVVCPVCRKDTPVFLAQSKGNEVIACLPNLSGIIQTQMEVDVIRILREGYVCLACGVSFRRIFEYEVGKGQAQVQQQPAGR